MKTRRLARAVERGRVGWRRAQALGLVSRIIVRREGGGSGEELVGVERGWPAGSTNHRWSCCSGRSRLRTPWRRSWIYRDYFSTLPKVT